MEILYNKFGLEPYDMILIEDGGNDEKLYSLGDYWFVYWNGFEYERLVEATEKFLADPKPYREASFIEDDLRDVAKGIAFATGYKRLTRVGDELFGISLVGDLNPLDIPIEVVERFKTGYIYDLRQGLVLSEVKKIERTEENGQ